MGKIWNLEFDHLEFPPFGIWNLIFWNFKTN